MFGWYGFHLSKGSQAILRLIILFGLLGVVVQGLEAVLCTAVRNGIDGITQYYYGCLDSVGYVGFLGLVQQHEDSRQYVA